MEKPLCETTAATSFDRFKDLTRKLIKAPKEESDARLADEKARKAVPMVDVKTS